MLPNPTGTPDHRLDVASHESKSRQTPRLPTGISCAVIVIGRNDTPQSQMQSAVVGGGFLKNPFAGGWQDSTVGASAVEHITR
jgi:hypothetical protein